MIEQPARVIAADGGFARVRVGARAGCTACDKGRGCGAGLFGRLLGNGTVDLELPNPDGARPGQRVRLGIPERLFLRLTWGLYGWPLLAGLAGAVIGHYGLLRLGGPSMPPLAQDLAALAAGVLFGAWSLRRARRRLPSELPRAAVQLLSPAGEELDCDGSGHH